jgi:hypothetical protein
MVALLYYFYEEGTALSITQICRAKKEKSIKKCRYYAKIACRGAFDVI